MNLLKPVSAALFTSLLAACSLIPPAQQSSQRQAQIQAQVQTAADPGQKPPEKVTFPSMVKTTPLDTNLPTDKNDQLNAALEQALAEKPADEGFAVQSFNLPQIFVVRFMANAKNLKQQVKIPENGAFQLVLEAGTGKKLEILDGDGSDGQATIRLPQHSYEALLHLQGPWQPNSSLEVNDELYYVQDTLSSKQGKPIDLNRWFLLGVRPLPVPSDWYSTDGQKLVLKFKTDTVKEFQMAWWTTNQQVPYPPGIQQIGPAGGTVKLSNIGELEVPSGSLSQETVVVMRQKREVPQAPDYDPTPGPDEVDVAPPVLLLPEGLQFKKPAYIRLAIDPQKTRGYLPSSLHYTSFPNRENIFDLSGAENLYITDERRLYRDRLSIHDWHAIKHFSYVRATVMPSAYSDNFISDSNPGDFEVAANFEFACFSATLGLPDGVEDAKPFYKLWWRANPNYTDWDKKKQAVCTALINSWKDYREISQISGTPPRWENFNYTDKTYQVIPVELKTQEDRGLTFARFLNFREANMQIDHRRAVEDLLDTASHENYHAVQIANVVNFSNINTPINPWGEMNKSVDRAWLPEGSARLMGSVSVYKHHAQYLTQFLTSGTQDSNPVFFTYVTLAYGQTLGAGLTELHENSLYDTPDVPGYDENKYTRMNIMSLIHAFYGTKPSSNNGEIAGLKKVHEINVDYIQTRSYGNNEAVEALFRNVPLESTFPNFGARVALKDYSMGTEDPNNFKKILNRGATRPIQNSRSNLETVNYTLPAQPNGLANPISVTIRNTPNNPQMVTNSSLQNLQMAHRYVEFPLVTQKLSDKDPKKFKDPYMAYIYLDRASAEGLTDEQAEDLIAKGTRVLVLKNPKPLDNWKDEKPLLAKVKWLSDPKIVAEPLKFEKRINVPTESRNPSIKGVLPRSVYILGIPIPQEDRPTQNNPAEPHRVRLILSITNPYITANSDKKTISYQFKAFVSPTIWGKRAFIQNDGIKERKMMALSGSGFSSDNTVVYFKHYKDGIGDIPVKAKSVTFVENPTNAEEEQEILVEVPADAAPESESYIYAKSGTLDSGLKEKLELVCNMLPVGADFRITSEGNCKQSP